jgi:NAD(P)-dependent dehydrogenase (short-subunit alcohol dehydrogenase family)
MLPTVFITGSNRGIGLEFTKQYAENNWKVYASCRDPKSALRDINQLKKRLNKEPIDVLINNAGFLEKSKNTLLKISKSDLMTTFEINTLAPFLITQALLPNLKLGNLKTVANLSSVIASLSENYAAEWNVYPYKMSKAALNMLMSCLAADLKYSAFRILLLDPGWVKTDMGGKRASVSAQVSVAGMRAIINDDTITSRSFIDYKGQKNIW